MCLLGLFRRLRRGGRILFALMQKVFKKIKSQYAWR